MKNINCTPITDTNSTLFISFIGNFTPEERSRVLNTVEKEIPKQQIYCNDLTGQEWSYDFKSACGYWIENITYTDSLRKVMCAVCAGTRGV